MFQQSVNLKPHHLFTRNGILYLFFTDEIKAQKISPDLASIIESISAFATPIPPELADKLREAGLLDEPVETQSAPAAKIDINKLEFPVSNISMNIIQDCNMSCVYCYGMGGEYSHKGAMSLETARKSVDWLIENSQSVPNITIGFFGGEPLMNLPLLKETVAYAKRRGRESGKEVAFSMNTNATLITDEILAYLKREGINIAVSFDGPPEIHDSQRPFKGGKGTHETVTANIGKILAEFPDTSARGIVYGGADPLKVKEEMKRAGFKSWTIGSASPVVIAGAENHDAEETSAERMLELIAHEGNEAAEIIKQRRLPGGIVGVCLMLLATGERRIYFCGVGKGMAAISADGDIYPCHRFVGCEETKMGNIAGYKAGKMNGYHTSLVTRLPACSGCWGRFVCGGGCFYDHLSRTGDMHTPGDSYCRINLTALETAIAVYCELDDGDIAFLKAQAETGAVDKIRP